MTVTESPTRLAPHPPLVYGVRPVLGLLVGSAPPGLRDLLIALYPRCNPRHVHPDAVARGEGDPIAYLVAAYDEPVPTDRPYAWWVSSPVEAHGSLADGARVLLTHDPTLAEGLPVEVLPWAPQPVGTAIAPAVRARLRIARGLPAAPLAVYETGEWSWHAADDVRSTDAADTVCALAAAVVATSPGEAVRAMAWGAPTVLDPATAAAVAAQDGVSCVVAGTGELRLSAAHDLAGDHVRAARLSRAGRELVTARHDLAALGRRVADRLGLPSPGDGPRALIDLALDELGAPDGAMIRNRASAALAGFANRARPRDSPPQPEVDVTV